MAGLRYNRMKITFLVRLIGLEMLNPTRMMMCLLLFMLSMPTFAQNIEKMEEGWVLDQTNTFSRAEFDALNSLCEEVNRKAGAELVVVLIPSTNGIDYVRFAENLFDDWGVGSAAKNDGILIFVAKQDRKIRIALGDGIDSEGHQAMAQEIYERVVKPNFRAGKFGEGTYLAAYQCAEQILGLQELESPKSLSEVSVHLPEGSNGSVNPPTDDPVDVESSSENVNNAPSTEIDDKVNEESPEEVADEILDDIRRRTDPNFGHSEPVKIAKKRERDKKGPLVLLFLLTGGTIGVGGVALVGGRYLLRGRTRVCPKCQEAMAKLDEQADDEYLEPPELIEERLGSVNYDVWACLTCEDVIKLRYGVFFSRYSNCPQCRRKTKNKISRTVVRATEHSGGVVEVTETCANCSYHNRYTYRTPRKNRSSNGMSSGFGGGRRGSSGGGRSSSSRGGRSFGGGRTSGGGGGGGW